jgi:stage IV sporulation protein FB
MTWYERPYAEGGHGSSGHQPRFTDNPLGWSLPIARISGIGIRVHFIFILYILIELLVAGTQAWFAARWLGLLFTVVLLHELGHCYAARSVGGIAQQVLMWPLGGLAFVQAPQTPAAQFVTTAGGPAVNVVLCLLAAVILTFSTGTPAAVPINSFQMMEAARHLSPGWQEWIFLLFCVSWVLLLFNLVPMYPLDGGRLLQSILWPYVGLHRSMQIATTAGMVGAIGLGLLGLAKGQFILVGIAIFGYITCLNERRMLATGMIRDESLFGYDFSGGYTTLEGGRSQQARTSRGVRGLINSWRLKRALRLREEERRRLEQEEAEVDRILTKVHQSGIQSLTRAERKLLQNATRRRQSVEGGRR